MANTADTESELTDHPQPRVHAQTEYDDIVQGLAAELADEIADGGDTVAKSIAQSAVAGVRVVGGKPVISQIVEYEGGTVETLDYALYPMEVLRFTRASGLSGQAQGPEPYVWSKAVEALKQDLAMAYEPSKAGDDE
jgi:hypothetical protein